MTPVTHPRGRLPRRVFWVRRGMVLALALLLVFGIGKLLGGTGVDASPAIEANTSSVQQPEAVSSPTLGPVAPTGKLRNKAKVAPAPPSGECRPSEVSALPSIPQAWAAMPIVILVQLQGTQPACTFEVSAKSLVVKIANGKRRLWSSQDCTRSIKPTQVVVRSSQPVAVPVVWSARRSDEECTNQSGWVMPGFYDVYAAAVGSTASNVRFEVTVAPKQVVTRTPKPRKSASTSPSPAPRAEQQEAAKPSRGPSKKP